MNTLHKIMFSLISLLMGVIITFIGANLNMEVVNANSCRMPVLFQSQYQYVTETHFTFQNFSEINKSHLADQYHFREYIYSIGDVFLFIGMFGMVISTMFMLRYLFIIFREEKNENKK